MEIRHVRDAKASKGFGQIAKPDLDLANVDPVTVDLARIEREPPSREHSGLQQGASRHRRRGGPSGLKIVSYRKLAKRNPRSPLAGPLLAVFSKNPWISGFTVLILSDPFARTVTTQISHRASQPDSQRRSQTTVLLLRSSD
jgi:hypothetical protein